MNSQQTQKSVWSQKPYFKQAINSDSDRTYLRQKITNQFWVHEMYFKILIFFFVGKLKLKKSSECNSMSNICFSYGL